MLRNGVCRHSPPDGSRDTAASVFDRVHSTVLFYVALRYNAEVLDTRADTTPTELYCSGHAVTLDLLCRPKFTIDSATLPRVSRRRRFARHRRSLPRWYQISMRW